MILRRSRIAITLDSPINDQELRTTCRILRRSDFTENKGRELMKIRVFAAAAVLCLLATATGTAQGNTYGAIAYSYDTYRFGYATNHGRRVDAERAAVRFCKARDCAVQLWFRNTCAVLVVGDGGDQISWAHDPDSDKARRRALRDCRGKAENCKVVVNACSADE
jgi:hypothetical protein